MTHRPVETSQTCAVPLSPSPQSPVARWLPEGLSANAVIFERCPYGRLSIVPRMRILSVASRCAGVTPWSRSSAVSRARNGGRSRAGAKDVQSASVIRFSSSAGSAAARVAGSAKRPGTGRGPGTFPALRALKLRERREECRLVVPRYALEKTGFRRVRSGMGRPVIGA
ncbi:hypothetical protein FHR32_004569 [Streptosporangium album]|uniref:Uncharacterized protein n=1 Tax=Streptosporangium album TaxID=47479 RepID=A0A7W7RXW5_9ACTN|nr:hypothetical protein [Streptosporangium album]MBB4940264.1 hypothetical protein [Streptosporangium album]